MISKKKRITMQEEQIQHLVIMVDGLLELAELYNEGLCDLGKEIEELRERLLKMYIKIEGRNE